MVVYLAADWTGDIDAVNIIHHWNDSYYYNLNFVDIHEKTQSRDTSRPCSIEASLCQRMNKSSTFVLIVGKDTNNLKSGSCQYCCERRTGYSICYKGYNQNYKSYIDYECDKAARDGKRIIVLYNSVYIYKDRCPESVRNIGIHIPMKGYDGGWNYSNIRNAIMGF